MFSNYFVQELGIVELTEFALDGKALLAFINVTNNLGIDVKRLRNLDNLLGNLRANVDLHAVTHVEYLIHLFPIGARTLVDGMEEWGHREHVVLDDAAVVVDKVQNLGLGATCTVNHTVNLWAELVEQLLDDGCVGTCGR